jgi:copper chaperone
MTESFELPDMTCGGCVRKVTQAVQRLDPQARLEVDLPQQQVQVQSERPRGEIEQALREAGFQPA